MIFVYRLLYCLGLCVFSPILLFRSFFKKKPLRFFCRLWPKKGSQSVPGKTIMFHAVSVGETVALSSIVSQMAARFPDDQILVSNVTETGYQTSKRIFPSCVHVFLPFDLFFSVQRFFSFYDVRCIIIAESDIWPELGYQAQKKNIPVFVINGTFSDRSYKRSTLFPFCARFRFSSISHFCMQNELFAERLHTFGVPKDRITITGNIKTDILTKQMDEEEKKRLREILKIESKDLIIILASTHHPEEVLLVEKLWMLMLENSYIKCIVVPRHPDRFVEVYKTLSQKYSGVALFSSIEKNSTWKILVIDAMGMLQDLYQISTIAVVAGSFIPSVGGHNIIEPTIASIPIIVGPHMHSQKSLMEIAEKYNAVTSVSLNTIASTVEELLLDGKKYMEKVFSIETLKFEMHGANEKTTRAIFSLLEM